LLLHHHHPYKKNSVWPISLFCKFSLTHIILLYACLITAQHKSPISSIKHLVKRSVQDNSLLSLWIWKINLHEIWGSYDVDLDVTQRSLIDICRHTTKTCCLHLQDRKTVCKFLTD
jgi:hypothetical protein